MTPKFFIALLLTIVFLTQCLSNDNHSNEDLIQNLQVPESTFSPKAYYHPPIYGTWTHDFPFYSSELTIKENGTFIFHEHGCMGHGYSEGLWINSGETYILTSFAKYNGQSESKIETIVSPTKSKNRRIKSNPTDSTSLVINIPEFTLPEVTYNVNWPDTSNVYYDKVIFRLVNDTLYRLGKSGITTEAKFVFAKNYR